jgi:hypothetical protein
VIDHHLARRFAQAGEQVSNDVTMVHVKDALGHDAARGE